LKKKFFILSVPVLLLTGCRSDSVNNQDEPYFLNPAPITVPLNTAGGYILNQFSGDTIETIVNEKHEKVNTGTPLSLLPGTRLPEKLLVKKITRAGRGKQSFIRNNVLQVTEAVSSFPLDTTRLKKVKRTVDADTAAGGKNKTGIPLPITGKKIKVKESLPVKALPMRSKDAATTHIQFLDVEQGLSYSYVYAVHEDKLGNLWFGMDGTGVVKYDGIHFYNYTEEEGLCNNIVTSIIEDSKGQLWFGTYGGVTMYDGSYFTNYTRNEGLPADKVWKVIEDRDHHYWFASEDGAIEYNGENIIQYTRREGLPGNLVFTCMQDSKGNIWMGTDSGAVKFDKKELTVFTPEAGLKKNYNIFDILEDSKNNLWFASYYQGLTKFDGKQITIYKEKDGIPADRIWSVKEDKKGNIWVGSSLDGIAMFDGSQFTGFNKEQGLSNNKVRQIFCDANNNIWFGTDGGGVNKLNQDLFEYFIPEELMENNRVRPILKDRENNLWLGTEGGGLGRLSASTGTGKDKLFTYYTNQDGFTSGGQRSLLQDKSGDIWIGTTGQGLIRFDGKNFTEYNFNIGSEEYAIYDLLQDSKGTIWAGRNDGSIIKYDGSSFLVYTRKDGLPGKMIYSILEDSKGNIWFCTEGAGVYKYDGTGFTVYSEKEGLPSNSVTDAAEDKDGNLWFATLGSGVCRFDGKKFINFSEQQGLPDNSAWSVFVDSLNRLWIGTDRGLGLFIKTDDSTGQNTQPYQVYRFGLQDGLKAMDFNLHSACVYNDRLWWGTGRGIPSISLNTHFSTEKPQSLTISHIEINENKFDFRNFSDSLKNKIRFSSVRPFVNLPQQLSLSYKHNHLLFHFAAIDWSGPHNIRYSYRLTGQDANWSTPSPVSMAEFRNLQPGNYELQVKAFSLSQKWSDVFVYPFVIRPPWWLTWWFKTIMVLMAAVLLYLVARFTYRYQLRKQKEKLEKQLAIQFERQRIASEMHDDIGAGLSGIRLMTEMAKTKTIDPERLGEMEKIYQSVGDVSARMKEVIWSLNTENDSLASLITYLQKQARQMMEHYQGKLSITIPGTIPDIKMSGEARRQIYLSLKEAFHNIIRHSGAALTTLTITCNDKLVITVADNGKGITKEKEATPDGNGLKNMKQRMRQLGGKLIIKNENGLTLIFEIPLKQFA
jgi:ligand-binding sensor domain-containing protein/two-component sensor histidine kinase